MKITLSIEKAEIHLKNSIEYALLKIDAIQTLSAKHMSYFTIYTIPLACLNTRTLVRVLASQTRTIPSSDPDINKFPLMLYAKQVTVLLLH